MQVPADPPFSRAGLTPTPESLVGQGRDRAGQLPVVLQPGGRQEEGWRYQMVHRLPQIE